jgi:thiosulfate reductase cytochrome b subunit
METQTAHPRVIRLAHWMNAVIIGVMFWSGFAMLVADRNFAGIVSLLPSWLLNALQLAGHKVQGRAWHLGVACLMTANGLFYLWSSIRSGAWRNLVPPLVGRPQQSLYNSIQRNVYLGVIVMGGVFVLTGAALWFKRQAPWLMASLGGSKVVLGVHVMLAVTLWAFVLVHIVQVARAGLPTLLSMITGKADGSLPNVRRGAAIAAIALIVVLGLSTIAYSVSAPTGIPGFLHWAIPSEARMASGGGRPQAASRSGNPSSD